MVDVLVDTPFLSWLPVRDVELTPVVPGLEWISVTLGLLIPCLLGFCIVRAFSRRLALYGGGIGGWSRHDGTVSGLELWPRARLGVVWFAGQGGLDDGPGRRPAGAACATPVPLRHCWCLALGVYLSLLNQMPTNPYFAQTLSAWEQGRFIRFHGIAQWLGWVWPYAALVYVMRRLLVRDPKN